MKTYVKLAILSAVVSFAGIASAKLSYVSPETFYSKGRSSASSAKDIECCVWYGKGDNDADYCIQKAKETGYLMFWFLKSTVDPINTYDCLHFREHAICRSSFIDVVNNYGYLILCCSEYNLHNKRIKDNLYGYVRGGKIYNEATGKYEDNKNGYPKTQGDIGSVCSDKPPSLHLLKFDQSGNILFHVYSPEGAYDTKFSPYATQFPIPSRMNYVDDAFAPWFKQYLDMFRAKEQIEEYVDAGGDSQAKDDDGLSGLTNVVRCDIFITETVTPTVYQIALHRDNVLFRAVTSMRDIMIKDRIYGEPTKFDDRCMAASRFGKWFVNYDNTMSAVSDQVMRGASIDVIPSVDCTISLNQRYGTGFKMSEYEYVSTTNIVKQHDMTENGNFILTTTTNIAMSAADVPVNSTDYLRDEFVSRPLRIGKLYRIDVQDTSTFDVFSTR